MQTQYIYTTSQKVTSYVTQTWFTVSVQHEMCINTVKPDQFVQMFFFVYDAVLQNNWFDHLWTKQHTEYSEYKKLSCLRPTQKHCQWMHHTTRCQFKQLTQKVSNYFWKLETLDSRSTRPEPNITVSSQKPPRAPGCAPFQVFSKRCNINHAKPCFLNPSLLMHVLAAVCVTRFYNYKPFVLCWNLNEDGAATGKCQIHWRWPQRLWTV